jgi:hypothetical protein
MAASVVEPDPALRRKSSEDDGPQVARWAKSLSAGNTFPCDDSLAEKSLGESDKVQNSKDGSRREQTKTLFSHRKIKALRHFAIFHLVPVAGVFAIMSVYIAQFGWAPDSNVISMLVLAAKVHESLIFVSLADILYHRIRHGLMTSRGVPFGFVVAPFHLSSPWALFHPELLSPFRGTLWRNPSHLRLGVLLVITLFLSITTGLSSTILLVPRQDWWETNPMEEDITYVADRYANIYPRTVTRELILPHCFSYPSYDLASNKYSRVCPQSGFQSLYDAVHSGLDRTVSGPPAIVNIDSYRDVHVSSNIFGLMATTPMAAAVTAALHGFVQAGMFDSLGGIKTLVRAHDALGTYLLKHPIVSVQCSEGHEYEGAMGDGVTRTPFKFVNGGIYQSRSVKPVAAYYDFNVTLDQRARDESSGISASRVNFLEIQRLVPVPISAAFLTNTWTQPDDEALEEDDIRHTIQLCLVDARWNESAMWMADPGGSAAYIEDSSTPRSREEDMVRLDLSWITALNTTYNVTTSQINADGRVSTHVSQEWTFNTIDINCNTTNPQTWLGGCHAYHYALYFADALARQTYYRGVYAVAGRDAVNPDYYYQWRSPMIDVDVNSSFYSSFPQQDVRDANHTKIETLSYCFMYSYRLRDLTVRLSMAVMLGYVVFVLCHFIVILGGDGWHSRAWSELGELFCLAMQSTPSELLQNTGGGVKYGDAYRLQAFVREARGTNKVELALEVDEPQSGSEIYTLPQPDVKYG